MAKSFDFYADPGHGWLKVEKKTLKELGISSAISTFSYQQGEFAYLEEDCDASLFVNTFKAKFGKEPKINFHHSDKRSRIRNYNSYIAF